MKKAPKLIFCHQHLKTVTIIKSSTWLCHQHHYYQKWFRTPTLLSWCCIACERLVIAFCRDLSGSRCDSNPAATNAPELNFFSRVDASNGELIGTNGFRPAVTWLAIKFVSWPVENALERHGLGRIRFATAFVTLNFC